MSSLTAEIPNNTLNTGRRTMATVRTSFQGMGFRPPSARLVNHPGPQLTLLSPSCRYRIQQGIHYNFIAFRRGLKPVYRCMSAVGTQPGLLPSPCYGSQPASVAAGEIGLIPGPKDDWQVFPANEGQSWRQDDQTLTNATGKRQIDQSWSGGDGLASWCLSSMLNAAVGQARLHQIA